MRTHAFRRIARLFAAALLLWTVADLCDFGLCVHAREPIAPASRVSSVRAAGEDGTEDPGDDCFCCSPFVVFQRQFRITLDYAVTWTLPDPPARHLMLASFPHYHPPLA